MTFHIDHIGYGGEQMKVKIGDTVYDGDKELIMLYLSDKDKENIAHMLPEATRYAEFSGLGWTVEEKYNWMDEGVRGGVRLSSL